MFNLGVYGVYQGSILGAKALYAPVSTYAGTLGFARSFEGACLAFKQAGKYCAKQHWETAAKVCVVLGKPEETICTLKNSLGWFELYTRVARLPEIGNGSWQKGVALIAQIGQKTLDTFLLIPMKWFDFEWHKHGLKFTKEVFSGIASFFGAWAAHQEVLELRAKMANATGETKTLDDLDKDLKNIRKQIEQLGQSPEHLVTRQMAIENKIRERAEKANEKAQKIFLFTLGELHGVKKRALEYYYTKFSRAAAVKAAAQVIAELRKEEAQLEEEIARRQILRMPQKTPVTETYRAYEQERIAVYKYNVGVSLEHALRARDFNIGKCFMAPVAFFEFFGAKGPKVQVYEFAVGLAITALGFRRCFGMLSQTHKPLPQLCASRLLIGESN